MKKYKILVVEDDNKRIETFIEFLGANYLVITDTAKEATKRLADELFNYVFLNGKLRKENGSGILVARFVRDVLSYEPEVFIHTWDKDIVEELLSILPTARHIPYGTEDFYLINIGEDNEE